MAIYIFALSIVCVFLFMAALYESWVRPLVIIFTVPLAMFGAVVGLWLYDMPLDVFGQIGLVMLIGLETKNAILIVEFGVELQKKHGMSIIDSAKEASRQRLRPILMTSFAFVMGVLPMARATGAGAYSRNSLGIVIAFGILISTILGRFVIPIYYVLGERLIALFSRGSRDESTAAPMHKDTSPRSRTWERARKTPRFSELVPAAKRQGETPTRSGSESFLGRQAFHLKFGKLSSSFPSRLPAGLSGDEEGHGCSHPQEHDGPARERTRSEWWRSSRWHRIHE